MVTAFQADYDPRKSARVAAEGVLHLTSSVDSPKPADDPRPGVWRPGWPSRIVSLTPLWVLLIGRFETRTFGTPPGAQDPNILGILVTGLVMTWMLIGLYVVWNARTLHVVAIVYMVFTIPATFAAVLAPALVLILQNPQ